MAAKFKTKYTQEEIKRAQDIIIEKIIQGKSLSRIFREDIDMDLPSMSKVFDWLNPKLKYYDQAFAERYARATTVRSEKIFDEILEIADDSSQDYYVDDNGKRKFDSEHWQRSKLKIEARKWFLAKVLPSKYGERSTTVIESESLVPIMTKRMDPKSKDK